MTPEELRAKEIAVRREFPQVTDAFSKVREAMMAAWHASGSGESEKRERLFRAVRTLDDVQSLMAASMGAGSEAIEEYAKKFATTGE